MSVKNDNQNRPSGVIRVLGTRRFLVLNLLVFCVMAWALVGEWIRTNDLSEQVSAKIEEADALHDKYIAAAAEAKSMESGYLAEKEARLKLNLQKPGEKVVIIKGVESEQKEEEGDGVEFVPAPVPKANESNYLGWWRYFFQ